MTFVGYAFTAAVLITIACVLALIVAVINAGPPEDE